MEEKCLQTDTRYGIALHIIMLLFGATGLFLSIRGALRHDAYEFFLPLSTFILYPGIWAVHKIFHWQPSNILNFWIYVFAFLAYSLGGAAQLYTFIPGYDTLVHTLSGVFVSRLALALYLILERKRSLNEHSPATAAVFVFFASMAVAGLFELAEYTVSPIVGRDLQCVQFTGVGDTMQDMLVCMIGTLLFLPFIIRFFQGKYNLLTGGVAALMLKNHLCAHSEEEVETLARSA